MAEARKAFEASSLPQESGLGQRAPEHVRERCSGCRKQIQLSNFISLGWEKQATFGAFLLPQGPDLDKREGVFR